MKKNGFTLLELLICVTLLSVVILFLFRLINDVRSEGKNTVYIKEIYTARNEFMSKVGAVTSKYGVCNIDTSLSTKDEAVIVLSICNGKTMTINVTSKKFSYSYDGDVYAHQITDDSIWIDTEFKFDSSTYVNYEYFEILFKTHKKGVDDTTLDDIGIYYGMLKNSEGSSSSTFVQTCSFSDVNDCYINIPRTGTYKLELWGGKNNGYGSYTYAEIHLEEGSTLYGNRVAADNGHRHVFLAFYKKGDGTYANYSASELIAVGGGNGNAGSYNINYVKNPIIYVYNLSSESTSISSRQMSTSCLGTAVSRCGNQGVGYIKVSLSEYSN